MTQRDDQAYGPKVECQVCLSQIPHNEAKSTEGEDYVLYFCGLDCFDQWSREGQQEGDSHP